MLSIDPVERLSSTETSSPRSSKASERCDPTNPAPPVINTRIDSPQSGVERPLTRRASQRDDGVRAASGGAAVLIGAMPTQEVARRAIQRVAEFFIIQEPAQH